MLRSRTCGLLLAASLLLVAACTPNVSGGAPSYPPMPTGGRYASQQFTDAQLTVLTARTYGTAIDATGAPVSLLLDLYLPPGVAASPPS